MFFRLTIIIIITVEMEVLVFQQALIFGFQNGIHPKNSYLFIRYEIRWNFKKVAEKRSKSTRDVWNFLLNRINTSIKRFA